MKRRTLYLTILFLVLTSSVFTQDETNVEPLKESLNYGRSVAVFGGSVSVIPESDSAKILWKKHLGMTVTNYGVPGAGFSSLQGKSLQAQVNEAGVFDIYILWASTNDYTNKREVGSYTDYTEFDGFDEGKLTTQAGGINYCIKRIYEINPEAIIYFFTSSKAFNDRGGYDPFSFDITATLTCGALSLRSVNRVHKIGCISAMFEPHKTNASACSKSS